jgi:hypothetical protein
MLRAVVICTFAHDGMFFIMVELQVNERAVVASTSDAALVDDEGEEEDADDVSSEESD